MASRRLPTGTVPYPVGVRARVVLAEDNALLRHGLVRLIVVTILPCKPVSAPNNLPRAIASFVGRKPEISQLIAQIEQRDLA